MNSPQGPSPDVTAHATHAVMMHLLNSVSPIARREGEVSVVEYGRTMKRFVIALWIAVPVIALLAGFFAPRGTKREVTFAIWTLASFLLALLCLHLECFRVSIRYDADGLRLASPWRPNRFVPWSAITGVTFSTALQWYVVTSSGHGRIRLHMHLSGLESLLDELAWRGLAIPKNMTHVMQARAMESDSHGAPHLIGHRLRLASLGSELLGLTDTYLDNMTIPQMEAIGAYLFGIAVVHCKINNLSPSDLPALTITLLTDVIAPDAAQAETFASRLIQATTAGPQDPLNAIIHRGIEGYEPLRSHNHERLRESFLSIIPDLHEPHLE
jgi:hypothetical protein